MQNFNIFISNIFIYIYITQIISMTRLIQWTIHRSAELAFQITSVEKVLEYTYCPQETNFQSTLGNNKQI